MGTSQDYLLSPPAPELCRRGGATQIADISYSVAFNAKSYPA